MARQFNFSNLFPEGKKKAALQARRKNQVTYEKQYTKTNTKQANSLTVAQNYIERGWQPLPIPFKSKNPNFPKWQHFLCLAEDLPKHFHGKPQNIGVLLGTASRNLIDVDLDSPEAVKLAPFFLPATKAIFGRKSKPDSHYLYFCPIAVTTQYQFGEMIAEIRAENCQTVFPSSVHPSGEVVEWITDGEPSEVTFIELQKAVGKMASASALVKFWKDGNRHAIAMALAGGLLRNGFSFDETLQFIKAVCIGANEDETLDRLKAVETTFERIGKGEMVTGFPKLAELTDKKLVETICRWLEIEQKINIIPPDAESSEENTDFESNFILTEKGVFYVTYPKTEGKPQKKETFICAPLKISALLSDETGGNCSRLIEFKDRDGVSRDLILEDILFSGDGQEIKARLYANGLPISFREQKRLIEYIAESTPVTRALIVSRLGFHCANKAFVFPDTVISDEPKEIYLQNVDRRKHKFKTSGTLHEWQENIARYCVGNSRLMFAVSLAFASVLLPLSNETAGGFNLHGDSGTGKTSALYMAGSVWGGTKEHGFLETWRATSNSLESLAELHNHSLLILDEMKQVNPQEIGEIIYQLANGFGKSRAKQDASLRARKEWNLLFLSSGELTLEELMKTTKERVFGGQQARFVQIETNGKYGIFDNLHEFADGQKFADTLRANACKFYGVAIREFLTQVLRNTDTVKRELNTAIELFNAKMFGKNASGEVYRIASRFALVCAGGVLASMFGVTNWRTSEVIETHEKMFDEWLFNRGGFGSSDLQQGVTQALSFIETQAHRFQNETSEFPPINRAGFIRQKDSQTDYCISSYIFQEEVCRGFSYKKISDELVKRGCLIKGASRNTKTIKFKGLDRREYYVFRIADGAEDGCD